MPPSSMVRKSTPSASAPQCSAIGWIWMVIVPLLCADRSESLAERMRRAYQSFMDVIAALQRGRWFGGLDSALADALVAAGRVRALDEGQWIYSEGDEEPGLCLVVDGVLRLEASAGPERGVLIGLVGPGQAIGQSRRFGGGRRIVTASAQRPAHVLLVPDAALPAIADRAPGVWAAVIALLYDQLDAAVHGAALNLGSTRASGSPRGSRSLPTRRAWCRRLKPTSQKCAGSAASPRAATSSRLRSASGWCRSIARCSCPTGPRCGLLPG